MAATETSTRANAALRALYRHHLGEVYRYTYAVLGNHADAEDVTQTTFVNALRALERGETPAEPPRALGVRAAAPRPPPRSRARRSARPGRPRGRRSSSARRTSPTRWRKRAATSSRSSYAPSSGSPRGNARRSARARWG